MTDFEPLRARLGQRLQEKRRDGYEVAEAEASLAGLPESYDAFIAFARSLRSLPVRPDWPYREPDELAAIHAECDPRRSLKPSGGVTPAEAAPRIRAGFLASVCGCILGKPVEFNPTRRELEAFLSPSGEWPITGYISEAIIPVTYARMRGPMPYWNRTYRERIEFVMPDDDINYTLLGMLALEAQGPALTSEGVRAAWLRHLNYDVTCGPEQAGLADFQMRGVHGGGDWLDDLLTLIDGGDRLGTDHCGAQIRADAYGYACPGSPALAADLAYQDAALTHRGTGLYATLWTAAAISVALTQPEDALDVFRIALRYIPQRSRFAEAIRDGLEIVQAAANWHSGYEAIHARFPDGGHCCVYQESVTLMNTLRFARRVDEGICIQVMQGNDTDSYGATAGALLGCYLGPGTLAPRWLTPFRDELRTGLAWFYDRSLTAVAGRIADLPRRMAHGPFTGETRPEKE